MLDDAEEATPLPAGELLTLDMFHSINFKANVDRRSGGNGWTADAVKNQLKLWNLRSLLTLLLSLAVGLSPYPLAGIRIFQIVSLRGHGYIVWRSLHTIPRGAS